MGFIEDGQVGVEPFVPVYFEQEVQGLQVIPFKVGVLGVGFIRKQLQKGHEMFLNVVHYFRLLVAYVQRTSRSVSGRGQVGIGPFFLGMNVADSLVEDQSSLSAHQLEHEDES